MQQVAHAKFVVLWHSGECEEIPVQFNPAELAFDKSAQFAEITIPGLDSPLLQFVRGQDERLAIDLFFDTTEAGTGAGAVSVTTRTDRIYELLKIEPDRHAPPVCSFVWSSKFPGADVSEHIGNQVRTDFRCVVESVKQKFTLFSPEGVPLRATLSVGLREYKTLDEQLDQLNLNSPDRTQRHAVQAGETLAAIAGRYYQRPGDWRPIAEHNGLSDPRRLMPGRLLTIPPRA